MNKLPKYNRRSIRIKNYNYANPGYYFITICTYNRENLFGKIVNGKMILNSNGNIVKNEWYKTFKIRNNIILDAFVIMPNHFHTIINCCGNNGHYYCNGDIYKNPKHPYRDTAHCKNIVTGNHKYRDTAHCKNIVTGNHKYRDTAHCKNIVTGNHKYRDTAHCKNIVTGNHKYRDTAHCKNIVTGNHKYRDTARRVPILNARRVPILNARRDPILKHAQKQYTADRDPTTEQFGKPTSGSIPTIIRSFKSAVTKRINVDNKTPGGKIWQNGYYVHIFRSKNKLDIIRKYIINNPKNMK
ncbi:transposase [Bacteroidota bacterium]